MKKSISLIEIIFSIVILSIIFINSSNIILLLNQNNANEKIKLVQKIELESLRLFLQYHLKDDTNLLKLTYENNTLFYNGGILLKNVLFFTKNINNNTIIINITIKNKISIKQEIILNNAI